MLQKYPERRTEEATNHTLEIFELVEVRVTEMVEDLLDRAERLHEDAVQTSLRIRALTRQIAKMERERNEEDRRLLQRYIDEKTAPLVQELKPNTPGLPMNSVDRVPLGCMPCRMLELTTRGPLQNAVSIANWADELDGHKQNLTAATGLWFQQQHTMIDDGRAPLPDLTISDDETEKRVPVLLSRHLCVLRERKTAHEV